MIAAAEQQRDGSGVSGGSLCRSVNRSVGGRSAEASAEAVAVSAAVLVGRYIGHLVRCRFVFPCSFWYVLAYVCRLVCGLFVD